jgi:hypothetical protein
MDPDELFLKLTEYPNLRYVSVRSSSYIGADWERYAWLPRILQVLNFEDGGLRFVNSCFYDCFRVYGAKRRVGSEIAAAFLRALQAECSRAARSGKAAYPEEIIVIERIRVSIGYTIGGITTARIL